MLYSFIFPREIWFQKQWDGEMMKNWSYCTAFEGGQSHPSGRNRSLVWMADFNSISDFEVSLCHEMCAQEFQNHGLWTKRHDKIVESLSVKTQSFVVCKMSWRGSLNSYAEYQPQVLKHQGLQCRWARGLWSWWTVSSYDDLLPKHDRAGKPRLHTVPLVAIRFQQVWRLGEFHHGDRGNQNHQEEA